ncbi:MAG: alpha/beta hydrolase [Betaproteobacteria bacterium]|nr:alpha/beta hydrolase [Betaproteobacteria bacterium]
MKRETHLQPADVHGLGRLAIDATLGVTNLVEALHHSIARVAPPLGKPGSGRTRGITGFVYTAVRGVTGFVGQGIDAGLARLVPMLGARAPSAERDAMVSALNGVLGDHLEATRNPLAIAMGLRRSGRALVIERTALAAALPGATPRIAVMVHGLCMNDRQWKRGGHDHGALLARAAGCTPVYLRYNSGLHVSTNGRALAAMIESLVDAWPVPVRSVVLVGHSMGGLVSRSALHYAGASGLGWPAKLEAMFFLGTPHQGAPLERGGNWVNVLLGASPYTAPFARLARIRSAGITDLRHGAVRDEEWTGRDRFAQGPTPKDVLPIPRGVRAFSLAATTAASAEGARVPGDGLVPLASALGRHRTKARHLGIPKSRQWVGTRLNHLDLLSSRDAGARMVHWLTHP